MPTAIHAGHTVDIDEQGYMRDPTQWNRDIAAAIAELMGIHELTDDHWSVIEFCRADNKDVGEPPGVRRISARMGVHTRELYKLFPKGPGKMAARISGLPKPISCI